MDKDFQSQHCLTIYCTNNEILEQSSCSDMDARIPKPKQRNLVLGVETGDFNPTVTHGSQLARGDLWTVNSNLNLVLPFILLIMSNETFTLTFEHSSCCYMDADVIGSQNKRPILVWKMGALIQFRLHKWLASQLGQKIPSSTLSHHLLYP